MPQSTRFTLLGENVFAVQARANLFDSGFRETPLPNKSPVIRENRTSPGRGRGRRSVCISVAVAFSRCPPIFATTNHSAPRKICFSDVARPALKRLRNPQGRFAVIWVQPRYYRSSLYVRYCSAGRGVIVKDNGISRSDSGGAAAAAAAATPLTGQLI
ncbi:hypothetical protein DBV15_08728 [Temnothorax longispinosus]|uniref:Uncharacterized protein n=1 Tax=Temnothorax longispinosus TaxID=300112 RepID=A0A4S2KPY4_9HYME|nr:hypothetical protein DBV15_08728 [Temnothorax longispinosus]